MNFLLQTFLFVVLATGVIVVALFVAMFWWFVGLTIRRAIRYRSLSLALRELLS